MNGLDRLLQSELADLMDRLAPSAAGDDPTVRARVNDMETTLAAMRRTLLEDYGRWTSALDDLENLCALAVWRSAASEEAAEKAATPLAA